MPLKVKVDNATKEMINGFVNVGGKWKQVAEVLTKVNGVWKRGWKGNFIDLNVFHSTTSSYIEIEDAYENLPSVAAFVGLEMSVYGEGGVLLARETLGTDEEPEVISSALYSLYDDENTYATVNVYMDNLNSVIRYTLSREPNVPVTRIEVKVAKILYNK